MLLPARPHFPKVQTLFHPDHRGTLLLQRWLRQEQPSHLRLGIFKRRTGCRPQVGNFKPGYLDLHTVAGT
jgi:hypothetical protein